MMMPTGCLTVNLNAIAENWRLLNARLGTTACGAVIKADAYGLGAIPVARTLISAGCETLFVATMAEAIEVREQVCGEYQLVVLGGMAHNYYADCVHHNIVPVLTTNEQLSLWSKACESAGRQWPCVVKIDTGMHRFGLSKDDIHRYLDDFRLLARCSPMMLMSHLACADTPEATLNKHQLVSFLSIFNKARTLLPTLKASLVNSSGIFLGSEYFFDMARPGIALYGGNPTPSQTNPMQSVVSLTLPINQIVSVNRGETVGYGGTFIADEDKKIATVFGGYADGIPRCLGNRGHGYYSGYRVPIVGRISMDATAFDLSAIPDKALSEERGTIEILGEHQSVDEVAREADTISYEILTRLGRRFQRVYQ